MYDELISRPFYEDVMNIIIYLLMLALGIEVWSSANYRQTGNFGIGGIELITIMIVTGATHFLLHISGLLSLMY